MKRIIIILSILTLAISGCKIKPDAAFSVNTDVAEVGEVIDFFNESFDAVSYEWDFGDNSAISYQTHPAHVYNSTGLYTVELTAISRDGLVDRSFFDILILPATVVNIEVREYYDEYLIPDAAVTLYYTFADWYDFSNAVVTGYTDQLGIVEFYNVEQTVYFLDIWRSDHSNEALGLEDEDNIKLSGIVPNTVNYYLFYVDVTKKKSGEASRVRIEKVEKQARTEVKLPKKIK